MKRGLLIKHNHISRSQGQSLVASVAYRTRTRLYDEREQKTQDYSRRRGVIETALFAPDSVLERYKDYEGRELYERISNDYEHKEDQSTRRKEALLGREFIAALPRECSQAQAWEIAEAMGASIRKRGLVSIIAHHESDASDGHEKGNPHLHILILPRKIEKDGSFGKRYEALDPRGKRSEREMQAIREEYLGLVNARMVESGIDVSFYLKKDEEDVQKSPAETRTRSEQPRRRREAQEVARDEAQTPTGVDKAREEIYGFMGQTRRWKSRLSGHPDGKGKRDQAQIDKHIAALQALRGSAMAARDAMHKSEGVSKPSRRRSVNATAGVRHGARLSAGLHPER